MRGGAVEGAERGGGAAARATMSGLGLPVGQRCLQGLPAGAICLCGRCLTTAPHFLKGLSLGCSLPAPPRLTPGPRGTGASGSAREMLPRREGGRRYVCRPALQAGWGRGAGPSCQAREGETVCPDSEGFFRK